MNTLSFHHLDGWEDDDHLGAFEAFRRSAHQALKKPYRDGEGDRTFCALKPVFEAAIAAAISDKCQARRFFEQYCYPQFLTPDEGTDGLVTGFYEPVVFGSRVKTADFSVPIYSTPSDLVEITEVNRPAVWDPYVRFAQNSDRGLQPYADRGAIERGFLNGQGLELVYVADKIEAFFIHVQGAARIALTDGSIMSITYAAKSGHQFVGPGRLLVDRGEIKKKDISMQTVRCWLKSNPDETDDLLWQNRSFIFFKESPVQNLALGPIAAAKVQLMPGRSIAVDRLRHIFGSALYVVAPSVDVGDGTPLRRLMVAQDTGSAIVGNARGDLFIGSGKEAGEIAGCINAAADFYLLVPRQN